MECILCNDKSLTILSEITVSDLCALYLSWYSSDVSSEFAGVKSITYLECGCCGLRFFSPPITGSEVFYDMLSRNMGERYYIEDKSEYRFAAGYITATDSVLDVGAGCGHFSKYIKGQYVGLDFNSSAIAKAKDCGVHVMNEALGKHVQKHMHSYSVVTAFQVLEHMSKPVDFVRQCLLALKPGGLLIISVPSDDSYISLQENAILNMPPHHISRWSDNCLNNIAKIFGLTHISLDHERLTPIHFDTYIQTISMLSIRTFLHMNTNRLVDLSLTRKALIRLSKLINPLYSRVLLRPELLPNGHSVTAVYRSKE